MRISEDDMTHTNRGASRAYFAYGSNMDVAQMQYRCPQAMFRGTYRLLDHQFIINRRGVATIVPQKFHAAYGVLWNITGADEESLDAYEGIQRGTYKKDQFSVETEKQRRVDALVYVASDRTVGVARAYG